jgi:hypothetical protein
MTAGWVTLLETLAAGGVFTALIQLGKALLGRGKVHVDSAEVVQGMALQLVTPFAQRLREADEELDKLRTKFRVLEQQLDAAMDRAHRAESALRTNGLPVPGSRRWTDTSKENL